MLSATPFEPITLMAPMAKRLMREMFSGPYVSGSDTTVIFIKIPV